ncbi:hypothetical protein E2562_020586 [Oryza meyeriana var. granulata]|uniref:Uncharacterized protein n=1 Tax=Oryza meyeriana var. granulata TaxID=110450 RepID=A0A6G1DY89_9ORYZ|nr:hypothetical protein E2562_020586 [Oryza meyeriana var. granulata]
MELVEGAREKGTGEAGGDTGGFVGQASSSRPVAKREEARGGSGGVLGGHRQAYGELYTGTSMRVRVWAWAERVSWMVASAGPR